MTNNQLPITSPRATLIGLSAILMWSTLPLLILRTGGLPPFEVIALAFCLSFTITLIRWKCEGASLRARLKLPWQGWLLGIWGIFGFHFFYFLAMRLAPPVEALLIDNLWPLLIVMFSLLAERGAVRWWHIAGCLAGFSGVALMTTGGESLSFRPEYAPGYLAAFACAFIWSSYSILSGKLAGRIPHHAIGAYCGISALLSVLCHLALEESVAPTPAQWLTILLIGLGPMGFSFFTWDYGMRHGDIKTLGALSYLNALVGTLLLVAFGYAQFTTILAGATMLVLGGAALGSWEMLRKE